MLYIVHVTAFCLGGGGDFSGHDVSIYIFRKSTDNNSNHLLRSLS